MGFWLSWAARSASGAASGCLKVGSVSLLHRGRIVSWFGAAGVPERPDSGVKEHVSAPQRQRELVEQAKERRLPAIP